MGKKQKQLIKPHSEKKQKEYERLIRLEYGPDIVNESVKLWNSYSKAQKERISEEGNQIYDDLLKALKAGQSPQSDEVQAILPRWHQHLRYFYEPTLDILRGLGATYNTHPDFIANFKKLHPNLPGFLQEAISLYVDDLETAAIQRLLDGEEHEGAVG